MIVIDDKEFAQFQRFIFKAVGITMSESKKALGSGRLARRLAHHQIDSYGQYLSAISTGCLPGEETIAVDLLATNETYFFRENKHFDLLRELATEARADNCRVRIWSAASSSGEQAHSIAIVLADVLEERAREVSGSDISTRMLAKARAGLFPLQRSSHIPADYLQRYCRKSVDHDKGRLLVERQLRNRRSFGHINLNETLPPIGALDVTFLRNVMIYFSNETKRQMISRGIAQLKLGGYLLIGHSETQDELNIDIQGIAPSIYRKPE